MFAASTTHTDATDTLSVHADRESVSLWYQTVINVTKAVSDRFVGDESGKERRGVREVGRATPLAIAAFNGVRPRAVVAWLDRGLGSGDIRDSGSDRDSRPPLERSADPLGLGLNLGLGDDAAKKMLQGSEPDPEATKRKLLIKAEC